jgi:hypothetical protein
LECRFQVRRVEQAAGQVDCLAEGAFTRRRGYARTHRLQLSELANDVVVATAPIAAIRAR